MSVEFIPGDFIRFTRQQAIRSIDSGWDSAACGEFIKGTFGIVVGVVDVNEHPIFEKVVRYAFIVASDGAIGWLKVDKTFLSIYQLENTVIHV